MKYTYQSTDLVWNGAQVLGFVKLTDGKLNSDEIGFTAHDFSLHGNIDFDDLRQNYISITVVPTGEEKRFEVLRKNATLNRIELSLRSIDGQLQGSLVLTPAQ